MQDTTKYKIRTRYYVNIRGNKHKESPKTKETLTVNLSGCSSMYEAELVVLLVSFSSSSGTNMGLKYYLSLELFSEINRIYSVERYSRTVLATFRFLLRATSIKSTLTVFTPSNIF